MFVSGFRIGEVPAFVYDSIGEASRLEAGSFDGNVGAELRLIDGKAVGVPAIPAHWWRGRENLLLRLRAESLRKRDDCKGKENVYFLHAHNHTANAAALDRCFRRLARAETGDAFAD